jgi:hypothetical protein
VLAFFQGAGVQELEALTSTRASTTFDGLLFPPLKHEGAGGETAAHGLAAIGRVVRKDAVALGLAQGHPEPAVLCVHLLGGHAACRADAAEGIDFGRQAKITLV